MKKVYALGVMKIEESPRFHNTIKDSRLWSLYAKFEDAEEAVLKNYGDIFEYYYNYALIEEVWVHDPSDMPTEEESKKLFLPQEWWYKAEHFVEDPAFDNSIISVSKTEKPASLEKIVFFWVG